MNPEIQKFIDDARANLVTSNVRPEPPRDGRGYTVANALGALSLALDVIEVAVKALGYESRYVNDEHAEARIDKALARIAKRLKGEKS